MKKHISVLLVLVMLMSVLTMGMGLSAYADAAELKNEVVSAKKSEKKAENEEKEEAPAEDEDSAEATEEAEDNEEEKSSETDKAADKASKEDTDGNFDQRLVGEWWCYAESLPEDWFSDSIIFIEEIGDITGFFCNGAVNSTKLNYAAHIAKAGEALVISAKNGEMDYYEKLCEFTEEHPELFTGTYDKEYIEELETCSNVEVTYEFFDFTEKGDGDYKPSAPEHKNMFKRNKKLFRKDKEDGLIIKIEADVQVGPLEQKHMVWEYKFHKEDDFLGMLKWSLLGEWEDSMGNTWKVAPYIPEDKKDDTYVSPDCVYVLTDSKGKEHVTDTAFWSYIENDVYYPNGYVDFWFKTFDTPEFEVESMSHDEVVLKSESGKLVLTRTAEPSATDGMDIPQ